MTRSAEKTPGRAGNERHPATDASRPRAAPRRFAGGRTRRHRRLRTRNAPAGTARPPCFFHDELPRDGSAIPPDEFAEVGPVVRGGRVIAIRDGKTVSGQPGHRIRWRGAILDGPVIDASLGDPGETGEVAFAGSGNKGGVRRIASRRTGRETKIMGSGGSEQGIREKAVRVVARSQPWPRASCGKPSSTATPRLHRGRRRAGGRRRCRNSAPRDSRRAGPVRSRGGDC